MQTPSAISAPVYWWACCDERIGSVVPLAAAQAEEDALKRIRGTGLSEDDELHPSELHPAHHHIVCFLMKRLLDMCRTEFLK